MTTWGGTISVSITHPNKSFLNGNLNLANPYAVRRQAKSWIRDMEAERIMVLKSTVQ